MTSIPDQPPPPKPKRWAPCALCQRTVTTADLAGGGKMVVERCLDDRGNIGLTDPLFEGGPLLAVPGIVSRYRAHRCKGALASTPAFSAENFTRKKGDPTKSPGMSEYFLSDFESGKNPKPRGSR
jgi:hypothetical protein